MFSKIFKRKHLSDNVVSERYGSTNKSSRNGIDIKNNNETGTKLKPIIYFSTDKGKYVCANVPDNLNILSDVEYKKGRKLNSTQSYPQDTTYSIIDVGEYSDYDTLKKQDDYKCIDDIYDSYFDDTIESSNSDTKSKVVYSNPSNNLDYISNNLDYISKNFAYDIDNGIYYFNKKDLTVENCSLYSGFSDSMYSNL